MRFGAQDVARATRGVLHGPNVTFVGATFDSREVRPGQLFVPLVVDRDGHDYIDAALAAGAAGYLTSRPAGAGTAIIVEDTLQALMDLAADRRRVSRATVVGITGSVGKTTTKDFARAAVGASRRVAANVKSYNNDFGLPTTVLNAPDDTEVLITEMGMRGRGEIARLCRVAAPTVGVITRVAEAHSDRLGGIDGVARAKAELVEALPPTGTAILNADDPRVAAMAGVAPCAVVTYGSTGADVAVGRLRLDARARASFVAATPWGTVEVTLAVPGAHMVANAAAALSLAGVLGADLGAAAAALGEVTAGGQRMVSRPTSQGGTVLDDSYNANPTSMRAALDTLAALPARRRVAVLGVMAEIADTAAEHRAIAAYAAARGIDVVAIGTDLYGVPPCAGVDDAVQAVGSVAGGDAVLVKASRVAGLERVADALVGGDALA